MSSALMVLLALAMGSRIRPDVVIDPFDLELGPSISVRAMVVSWRQEVTVEDAVRVMGASRWVPGNEDELIALSYMTRPTKAVIVAGAVREDGKVSTLEAGQAKVRLQLATTCWPSGTMFLMVRRDVKKEEK